MNEKLVQMSRDRKKAHKRLLDDLHSPVYAAFLDMERATYADGALPKRVKELVAVGISVVIDCHSCMQWHIEQAAEAGADPRQVLEAVEVGIEMGGGPATVSARFALEVMADVFGEAALREAGSQGA
ncbi:carboxymuconolactone decarboxylase family protein [Solidesulfovibrio sp.]|uniref:carboxymuconolactone decarboxylase family protein n=1 Tax=Solidesulfovibrio sp. TaxID=2910990 RepID=UPI002628D894|nr:carboxymuconolactone decarboxylase family protein [Solidesulfovibrio sp.]